MHSRYLPDVSELLKFKFVNFISQIRDMMLAFPCIFIIGSLTNSSGFSSYTFCSFHGSSEHFIPESQP